jgi:PKHD-type hydroxylase
MTRSDALAFSTEAVEPRGVRTVSFLRRGIPSVGDHFDWMVCAERLSEGDCDSLIAACRAFAESPPRTVGEDRLPSHRRAKTHMIGVTSETAWLFDMLCSVAEEASQQAYKIALTGITRPPQYVEYRAGWGQFDWHNDYSHGVPDAPRKLTIIIQLSFPQDYEGGALQVMGAEVDEMPRERGTVVVFPSLLVHRVTPIMRGLRKCLVSWIAGPRLV